MRKISETELKEIIEKHKMWIESNYKEGKQANLSRVNLSGKNLSCVNLVMANLSWAEMRRTNLSMANLSWAEMKGADLTRANLSRAEMIGTKLSRAYLSSAEMSETNLLMANLTRAEMTGANLSMANLLRAEMAWTNLSMANLSQAEMSDANLTGANLSRAEMTGTKLPYIPIACPDFGAFIGWKKCRCQLIVKLLIPYDAKRSSSTGRRCRCDKALVLAIENIDGTSHSKDYAISKHDEDFVYRVGETVSVTNFDPNRFNECSDGIHFFINRQQAVEY